MLSYVIGSLALGCMSFLAYLFFLRKGHFEEVEEVKYQMLRESDEFEKEENQDLKR